MYLQEYADYIGRMRQPLQNEIDNPSMFALSDSAKTELDLILLTPCTFLHAYNFIMHWNPRSVCLFTPSLRPEFISDIINLYAMLKIKLPTRWVFPTSYPHATFSEGQIKKEYYQNAFCRKIGIRYMENENVDNVYDIIVYTSNAIHYFSFYLTADKLKQLFRSRKCHCIHLPKSSTLFGGLTYDSALQYDSKFLHKLVPYDFVSIEDLYAFKHRNMPDEPYFTKYAMDPQEDTSPPEDFEGVPEPYEILDLMNDDISEGVTDE